MAAIWISGTALSVYAMGAGLGTIGVTSVRLLDAESAWLIVSGTKRIAQAARYGKTEQLLNAGALSKLVMIAADNEDKNVRIAAASAVEQMFADERARSNALANPGLIDVLSRCVDCGGARKQLRLVHDESV